MVPSQPPPLRRQQAARSGTGRHPSVRPGAGIAPAHARPSGRAALAAAAPAAAAGRTSRRSDPRTARRRPSIRGATRRGACGGSAARGDRRRKLQPASRARKSKKKEKSIDAVPPDPHERVSEGRTDQCHTVWHGSRSPARAHARTSSTRPLARPERSGYSRVLGDGHPRALVHHTPSRVNSTFAGLRVGYRTYSTGTRERLLQ